jgi:hypothetical protein
MSFGFLVDPNSIPDGDASHHLGYLKPNRNPIFFDRLNKSPAKAVKAFETVNDSKISVNL